MSVGKSFVPYTPIRIMYQLATFFVGLFILGFLWFALYSCISPLSAAITSTMTQFENMTSYPSYNLANTFMLSIWLFLITIAAFGLLYWMWVYGQRKNIESGYR